MPSALVNSSGTIDNNVLLKTLNHFRMNYPKGIYSRKVYENPKIILLLLTCTLLEHLYPCK